MFERALVGLKSAYGYMRSKKHRFSAQTTGKKPTISKHLEYSTFFAVSKQNPIVYSAARERAENRSYVGDNKTYVGDNSYLADDNSYVGLTYTYVGLINTYVELTNS